MDYRTNAERDGRHHCNPFIGLVMEEVPVRSICHIG